MYNSILPEIPMSYELYVMVYVPEDPMSCELCNGIRS